MSGDDSDSSDEKEYYYDSSDEDSSSDEDIDVLVVSGGKKKEGDDSAGEPHKRSKNESSVPENVICEETVMDNGDNHSLSSDSCYLSASTVSFSSDSSESWKHDEFF